MEWLEAEIEHISPHDDLQGLSPRPDPGIGQLSIGEEAQEPDLQGRQVPWLWLCQAVKIVHIFKTFLEKIV